MLIDKWYFLDCNFKCILVFLYEICYYINGIVFVFNFKKGMLVKEDMFRDIFGRFKEVG